VDVTTVLKEIATWPLEDQLSLLHATWDRILEGGWEPTASEEQWAEIDRRLEAHQANPHNVVTWDEIVNHVKRPR
jgi:putative addiction module component (TIGR02574 family)